MKIGPFIRVVVFCTVVAITAPTLVAMASGFTTADVVTFPPRGFTLHWYEQLFTDGALSAPIRNSLYVGATCVVLGIVLGVPAALALNRFQIRGRSFFQVFLTLGFASPLVVSGLGMLLLFTQLHVLDSVLVVGFAVAIVHLPFMLWAVGSSLVEHNPELEEAAATLGAEEVQQFLFVTLPSIGSGIFTGALLMFVFGITEFLLSLLLVTPASTTLPVYLFSSIRGDISPVLAAVAGVYVLFVGVLVWAVTRFAGADRYLYRSQT